MAKLICPKCGRLLFTMGEACGGSFLDQEHPSAVEPIVDRRTRERRSEANTPRSEMEPNRRSYADRRRNRTLAGQED